MFIVMEDGAGSAPNWQRDPLPGRLRHFHSNAVVFLPAAEFFL
jgi:hypothetical protein